MHPVGRRASAGLKQLAEAAHQPGNGEASDNRGQDAYVAKRIHFDFGQAYLASRSLATRTRPLISDFWLLTSQLPAPCTLLFALGPSALRLLLFALCPLPVSLSVFGGLVGVFRSLPSALRSLLSALSSLPSALVKRIDDLRPIPAKNDRKLTFNAMKHQLFGTSADRLD